MAITAPDSIIKGFERVAFVAADNPAAEAAAAQLRDRYGSIATENADVIVAIGGDGLMLHTLHAHIGSGVPIYGMNLGSVGFLMNMFSEADLLRRLAEAKPTLLHPLRMRARDRDGDEYEAIAINEVSLLRQTGQVAKIAVSIAGQRRLEELIGDGVLLATPAGSTAYNFSVQGPILPIDARLLSLTPISPFRPRRWRGALIPHHVTVRFDVLEADKRPVSAVADHREFRHITEVDIAEDRSIALTLLFDHSHSLEERIIAEQFSV